jgi:nitrite reductase/ring-hydroxylating ferredoxin subunit
MAQFVKIASKSDVPPGQAKAFQVDNKKIAVFNIDGTYYAIDDACTHKGGPLSQGPVADKKVTCGWHGAVFSLESGQALSGPAATGVAAYKTRVSGNDVEVEI